MHYYNENDKHAAAWLRELIRQKLIPFGYVDTRSICDVRAAELVRYVQCHFFAGIGGWPLAFRMAGIENRRGIWSGSAPCPPFSTAGKKKWCPECSGKPVPHPLKTGIFACVQCGHEWFADGRHLYPELHRLIVEGQPDLVFGEQVAGADGVIWFTGVRAALERVGYGARAADLCAAGVGAPHIRQRLYWVADANGRQRDGLSGSQGSILNGAQTRRQQGDGELECSGAIGGLAIPNVVHGNRAGLGSGDDGGQFEGASRLQGCTADSGLEHPTSDGRKQWRTESSRGSSASGCGVGGMGDANCPTEERFGPERVSLEPEQETGRSSHANPWSNYQLIGCADGKARRIESGTFPLAHGVPGRVGLLRGYGNAIVPQVAAQFIQAFVEAINQQPHQPVAGIAEGG